MHKDPFNGELVGQYEIPGIGRVTRCRNGVIRTAHISATTNPPSLSKLARQIRMRATAVLYGELKEHISSWHQSLKPGCSFYNVIVGDACKNTSTPFGLSDKQKKEGGVVIAPILVSQGDGPSIGYNYKTETTSICVGDEPLSPDVTFGTFCSRILEHNPQFERGNRLRLLFVKQRIRAFSADDIHPFVRTSSYSVFLDPSCDTDTPLSALLPGFASLLEYVRVGDMYYLTIDRSLRDCGFTFVHSSCDNRGRIHFSTQYLICRRNMWPEVKDLVVRENPKVFADIPFLIGEDDLRIGKLYFDLDFPQID